MHWQTAVEVALASDVPVILWGPPAIGKTAYIYALAKALDEHLEVVIASLREPSDFLGLPIRKGEEVIMAPPSWARRLRDHGSGLVVFDEITTAPPAVQATLLRVVLERVVGDLELPPGVKILAIANPADEAGGWDLSLPLTNRFLHIQAEELDSEAWARGLISGWDVKPNIMGKFVVDEAMKLRARSEIGGFLNHRPELMLQKPKSDSKDKESWPSPRSWEMAARLLGTAYSVGVPPVVSLKLMQGSVGNGAASEFMSWQKTLDLPDPAAVLAKPHKFKVPTRPDITFAALGAVVGYAIPRLKDKAEGPRMWENAWKILAMVCEAGQPDVAVPSARNLAKAPQDYAIPESVEKFGEIFGL